MAPNASKSQTLVAWYILWCLNRPRVLNCKIDIGGHKGGFYHFLWWLHNLEKLSQCVWCVCEWSVILVKWKYLGLFHNCSFKSYIKGIIEKNFVNLRRHARGTVNSLEVMKSQTLFKSQTNAWLSHQWQGSLVALVF